MGGKLKEIMLSRWPASPRGRH